MITVHGMPMSGDCCKVRPVLAQLGRACRGNAFAYTRCAADGGLDLSPCPAIAAGLARERASPGFVPMHLNDAEAVARFALADRADRTA